MRIFCFQCKVNELNICKPLRSNAGHRFPQRFCQVDSGVSSSRETPCGIILPSLPASRRLYFSLSSLPPIDGGGPFPAVQPRGCRGVKANDSACYFIQMTMSAHTGKYEMFGLQLINFSPLSLCLWEKCAKTSAASDSMYAVVRAPFTLYTIPIGGSIWLCCYGKCVGTKYCSLVSGGEHFQM